MKMTRLPVSLTLLASLLLSSAAGRHAQAQWIGATSGSGYVDGGNKDYLFTGNWTGGTINDNFSSVPNGGGLTVHLDGNRTTTAAGMVFGGVTNNSLDIASSDATVRTLTLGGNITHSVNNGGGVRFNSTVTVDLGGASRNFQHWTARSLNFDGKVTGAGRITTNAQVGFNNTGNDWTGGLTIPNGGIASFANSGNSMPFGAGKGDVLVQLGGLLRFGTGTYTVNSLSGAGTVNESGGGGAGSINLTLFNDASVNGPANSTFTGLIRDRNQVGTRQMQVTKTGAGTFTLGTGGTAAYTLGTFINAGTFLVNGTMTEKNPENAITAAGVSVNSGGTLGGTGLIDRPVTLAGGTLSPGVSAGKITIGDDLGGTSGTYLWELGGLFDDNTGTAGTDWDLVSMTGATGNISTVNVSNIALELDFDLLAPGLGPNGTDPFWDVDHTWLVLGLTSTASNNTNFSSIQNGTFDAGEFTTSLDGNGQIFLNFTAAQAVPEPTSVAIWSLIGLGLACYGYDRARRRK